MIWLWIILAIFVVLPMLLAALGMTLPKGHIASRRATYRQTPESLWSAITRFEDAPLWRGGLKRIERLANRNGHAVWAEHGRQGRLTYAVTTFDPPRRMVTTICDPKLPFGGTWTYELSPTAQGTLLTITEDGEIYNPIFRLLARYFFGYHGTIESYLTALSRKFSEEIAIESVAGA